MIITECSASLQRKLFTTQENEGENGSQESWTKNSEFLGEEIEQKKEVGKERTLEEGT